MMSHYEALLAYRRSVAAMYARVRELPRDAAETCGQFRRERDALFRTHPQSALSARQKANFRGLDYFAYDPAWRFVLPIDHVMAPTVLNLSLDDDGPIRLQPFGQVHLPLNNQTVSLTLFWIMGYGGGVFLHFRDATAKGETYGGGRYLLDTIKHADLGQEGDSIVIDFNYAYHPSCAYNVRWHCPLLINHNQVPLPIPAGEKKFADFE